MRHRTAPHPRAWGRHESSPLLSSALFRARPLHRSPAAPGYLAPQEASRGGTPYRIDGSMATSVLQQKVGRRTQQPPVVSVLRPRLSAGRHTRVCCCCWHACGGAGPLAPVGSCPPPATSCHFPTSRSTFRTVVMTRPTSRFPLRSAKMGSLAILLSTALPSTVLR